MAVDRLFIYFLNYEVIKREIQNSLLKKKNKTFDSKKSNKMRRQTGAFIMG